jgi:uncharacterized protein (TIGR02145 family)
MTILLTIEIEGGNLGPFNLYSNTNGYTNPFATNITKDALEAGYTSTSVPPNTTTVRVKSVGNCSNSIDIVLENTTTTSTTTTVPGVPCNGTSDSGGAGLKDLNVNLDPAGGVITFLFDPQGAADKMEFYHGLPQDYGINKVATTSQSASEDFGGNYGPFDDEYGTPPAPIIFPNNPTTDVDQFIGTLKGTVPTRQAEYTSDTGCTIPSMTIGSVTYDQVVWWRYDAADYLANPVVTVRVTGSGDNTLWNSIRICNVCTTTTTTSSSSTSTSTSTSTTTTTTTTYVCPNCIPGADVLIGTQTWTTCNLDVSTYANGDPIDEVTDTTLWAGLTTGAWCYYDNNSVNGPICGKLYNWYAVNDPRGLAPIGYHVPSIAEFTQLNDYLDAQLPTGNVGGKMKATGTIEGNDGCWLAPNEGATNSSGFRAIPGGLRIGEVLSNPFIGIDGVLQLWSSTENDINSAKTRLVNNGNDNLGGGNYGKKYGFSVRLIQD